ncbi:MAG TPA: hypothetical protein VMF91_22460 [Bryobacteraceae bacterium]|nr:hypothetical protein [Bryobacteraceae bacterium]
MVDDATAPKASSIPLSWEEPEAVFSGAPRLLANLSLAAQTNSEALPRVVPLLADHQHLYPGDTICVLADYSLLLSGHKAGGAMDGLDTLAALMTLGLDPRKTVFCRESDIAALPELYLLLSCALRANADERDAAPAWNDCRTHAQILRAALTLGLNATRVILDDTATESQSGFLQLLTVCERYLRPKSRPIEIAMAAPGPGGLHPPRVSGMAGEQYATIRQNVALLQDVLNEGGIIASAIFSAAIMRVREQLMLSGGRG